MSVLLTVFCHASTLATRNAAFPGDEPLDTAGLEKAAALAASVRRVDAAWTSPSLRARQTASALGLDAAIEAALRDADYGAWAGRTMAEIETTDPAGLVAWISDPAAAPHGGETIDNVILRTACWMHSVERGAARVVAVTHASVLRAAVVVALGAPHAAFWRIDVPPLCRLSLQHSRGVWTLRSIGPASGGAD